MSRERLRKHAEAIWPRLYLDTAELLEIGDGRAAPGMLERLVDATRRHGVIAIASLHHLIDVVPRGGAEAVTSLANAFERFPFRAVVTVEPTEIEPWTSAGADIELALAGNIREVLCSPAAGSLLAQVGGAHDAVFDAITAGRQEVGLERLAVVLRKLEPWIAQCRQDDASRARLHELAGTTPSVDAQARSPGISLARNLGAERERDPRRQTNRSDSVDAMHAVYFPYVDVATCDRQAFSCVEKRLSGLAGTRKVRLIRNGHLDHVVAAIESLPLPGPLPEEPAALASA